MSPRRGRKDREEERWPWEGRGGVSIGQGRGRMKGRAGKSRHRCAQRFQNTGWGALPGCSLCHSEWAEERAGVTMYLGTAPSGPHGRAALEAGGEVAAREGWAKC